MFRWPITACFYNAPESRPLCYRSERHACAVQVSEAWQADAAHACS